VARAYIDAQACQLHTYWTASKVARGQPVGPEASCNEIFRSELDVVVQETALALLGSDAELLEAGSPGEWLEGTLSALAGRADDWTNEMRRNLVAERLLGLGEG
jgi:alkylation response protein AidB-like acyl-CoA dehydrogenase